ncbi:hypothetical protein [Candidatus Amarolinea dominans]|uniref:hypothetical protein n=1 Tax=Candidatus Amarolinea dominans TaxID=3140696 RepID=UPI00313485D9|nr:hypothetical protein [Anaerolineae bacterium]
MRNRRMRRRRTVVYVHGGRGQQGNKNGGYSLEPRRRPSPERGGIFVALNYRLAPEFCSPRTSRM